MARRPDIKAQETISFKARSETEKKLIGDFKKLCLQDSIDQIDLFSEAITLVFKMHHWPPGNPQLTLETSLLPQKQLTPHCKCGKPAVFSAVHVASKQTHHFCRECFGVVPMRYDQKIWKVNLNE